MEKCITLIIIRTPFQAWLVQKVLEKEGITSFDIIYITQDDSEEDKHYYEQLYSKARDGTYVFVKRQKIDILNVLLMRIELRQWYKKSNYSLIVFASITSLVANSLVTKLSKSELITFDDGAANIVSNDEYTYESTNKRYLFYRSVMGASSIKCIKSRISKHYTLYNNFENIVESARLSYLEGWNSKKISKGKPKTYFIGSPFEEVMTKEQIVRLENYVKDLKVDFYISHPRERKMLNIGAKTLNKQGCIAEEAIVCNAEDSPIVLVGWFSTVMLNMSAICESRIVLLPKECVQTPELFELSKKAGCNPVLI